jgi:hypothetical protein
MIPFTALPVWTQTLLWYVILGGLTYGCYRFSEMLVLETLKEPLSTQALTVFRILSWILSLNFILAVFENQAFDGLVFFFVLIGLLGLSRKRLSWTVSGLALAAALKATPVMFFPYLAMRRRWKDCFLCVAFYLGLSLLPDLMFRITDRGTYFGNWIRQVALQPFAKGIAQGGMPSFWTGENPLNQSLRPLVLRLVETIGLREDFSLVLYAIYGLCLFSGAWVLSRSVSLSHSTTFDGSLIVTGMLLLSPMSSKSHFIVLMLPLMLATVHMIANLRQRRVLIAAVTLSFVLNNLTSKDLVGSAIADAAGRWSSLTMGTITLALAITYIVTSETQWLRRQAA